MYKALEKEWDFEPNSNISRLNSFLALYGQKYEVVRLKAIHSIRDCTVDQCGRFNQHNSHGQKPGHITVPDN